MSGFFNALSASLILMALMSVGFFMGWRGWMGPSEKKFLSKYIVNIAVPCTCITGLLSNLSHDMLVQAGFMLIAAVLGMAITLLLAAGLAQLLHLPRSRWGVFVVMTGLSNTLEEMFSDAEGKENLFTGNTTLGVVVTNAAFHKTQLTKIAGMTHNGYARAIRPVHTTADGDSIYALSLGDVSGDLNLVGAMAARAMEHAIRRAVYSAKSAYGLMGWDALPGKKENG